MIFKEHKGLIRHILLVVLLGIPFLIQAQTGKEAKLMRKANSYLAANNLVKAEEAFKDVLNLNPNNAAAAAQLGHINSYIQDFRESLQWFQKAASLDGANNDTLYLYLGIAYKRLNNYRQAREALAEFKKKHKTKDIYYERADRELKGCDFAEATIGEDPPYRIGNASINSQAGDIFPSYLDQRQEDVFLVFTSYRPPDGKLPEGYTGLNEPDYSDLYLSVLENDSTFGEPEKFSSNINTPVNDGAATFTADGLTMYYSTCNQGKKKGYGCSIYESVYDPSKKSWGKPRVIEEIQGTREVVVNKRGKRKRVPAFDTQPAVSKDGRTLFFISDRDGGMGGLDIWYSRKVGAGWSAPINVGSPVNTPFDERTPYLNDDASKLFFSSKGHIGFGGFDAYVSEGTVGDWSNPENLRAPINSSYDDYAAIFMNDDSLMYFASNREGGAGRSDIYWGKMNVYPEPEVDIAVQGVIRDKFSKEPIAFAIAILYEYQDESIVTLDTFKTDQTGSYNFPLEMDKNYKVLGNAPEYLANEVDVSTVGIGPGETRLERNIDIELEPIQIDKAIILPNIYYDFDKYDLRPEAMGELDSLINLLNVNPNIKIMLGSHTDTNGSEDYNLKLSANRAKEAVRYLINNGISPNRLSWYNYGESAPIFYPEQNDEQEQYNRRTEFRITAIDFK